MKTEIIKRGIFIYWAFGASFATVADNIFVSTLDHECMKTGSFYEPNNAVMPDVSFFSNYPSTQYRLASAVICASATNSLGAIAYTHQDGVCTVYGPGERSSPTSNMYAIAALPASELLECVSCVKPTYSSTHYNVYVSGLAVDGNAVDSGFGTIQPIEKPWWIVDLGETRTVHQVQIFPLRDGSAWRFHDVEIRIGSELKTNGDLTTYTLMCSFTGHFSGDLGFLICSKRHGFPGRYLSVQKIGNGTSPLDLMEVVVIARKM